MTDSTGLQGRELAVWRGERCLFEQLQFELASGQLALLVGPNGAGKTTLLRVLAGLAEPSAGSVTWNGRAVSELDPEQRSAIAYRGHLEGLKRELTIRENLEFHCAICPGSGDSDSVLTELELDTLRDVRVRYLSAGQRRRTALALLQLSGAALWLLDEPTTNLDARGRTLLRSWVGRHVTAGGLAVIATHQPDEFATPGALMIELR
jgi:heme exporter protein A